MSQKKCSKCGKEFECCNEQPGCWCESLYISPENLELLKKEFENCLCQQCLEGYGEGTTKGKISPG